MSYPISLVKRHSLITFFILAYALAWALIMLAASVSLAFGFLALFGPAVAALIVAGVTESRAGIKDLLRRTVLWRVRPVWYTVAIGLPFLLAVIAVGLYGMRTGTPITISFEQSFGLTLFLAFMVIGEEIGWRGYALPRLQQRHNSLVASLILGVLWAAWHLPNALLPGLVYYVTAFPVFLFYVMGMTVLFTWLANGTRNSVLLAWIFHAAINVSGAYLLIGDSEKQWVLYGVVHAITALLIIAMTGVNLGRKDSIQAGKDTVEQRAVEVL